MGIKKFLQNILNTFTKTVEEKKQVFNKKVDNSLLINKPVVNDVKPVTTNTSFRQIELMKQISLSQLDKAILAASQIHYYPGNDIETTKNEINNNSGFINQKINVKVNAELLELPAGLIAMLDICNSSGYTFSKENKL